MSLLSDEDIKKELGKNIFIYPLLPDKIKGSSINLRASNLAWSLKTQNSIYNSSQNKLIIPANDTALIETEESIFVTNKISGSYHSKVKMVSKGIGHIGTTLDPEWIGPSLIALHNHSDNNIEIAIGETFVSIMFFYLKSSSKKISTNTAGRPELLNQFSLTVQEKSWLDEEWRKDSNKLKKKMTESIEFKTLKAEMSSKFDFLKISFVINILFIFICLIISGVFYYFQTKLGITPKDYFIPIAIAYITFLSIQVTK